MGFRIFILDGHIFTKNIYIIITGKLQWDVSATNCTQAAKHQAEIDWPRHYAALLEYYKEHGTCNVNSKHGYECNLVGMGDNGQDFHYVGKLGRWLRDQRQARKGSRPKLTPERNAQLQKLVDEGEIYF